MDIISEEYFEPTKNVTFWNEGTFTWTSSVQDLPVILKWHNFYSLKKALIVIWN